MSSETAISVANLSKCYHIYDKSRDRLFQMLMLGRKRFYREFWALQNVSLDLKKGETVGIIGHNGAGKSTLLQIICGTLTPTAGTLSTNGRITALLELGAGFNPDFTGRENIHTYAMILGISKGDICERFDAITRFADIGDFIEQPIKTYSSGMIVRLAFAIAVNVDPDILVVDEALSVGDIRFQNKCIRRMEEIKQLGKTILFVTHSTGMVEAFCDRVIWLRDGQVFKDGDPAIVVRQYINHMAHGIEDHHMTRLPARDLPPMLSNESGWRVVNANYNVRNRKGIFIEAVRLVTVADRLPVDRITDSHPHPLVLEAVVRTAFPVKEPLFGFCIHNELNEPIVHYNNRAIHQILDPFKGNTAYLVRYRLTLPPLREGQYLVSISVDDGVPGSNTLLCHVYDAWLFTVSRPQVVYKQAGYVQLENPSVSCEILSENANDA